METDDQDHLLFGRQTVPRAVEMLTLVHSLVLLHAHLKTLYNRVMSAALSRLSLK